MEKRVDIYDRVFKFASRVLKMNQVLSRNRCVNRNAMNQLVSSSSSIGSNLEEARAGQSRADFHAKLRIALKEARESQYWLRYIASSGVVTEQRITPLVKESGEIVGILTSIARSTNPHNPSNPNDD